MANIVDPFVVPIPDNVKAQAPDFWNYLQRFLHDLWIRTGGGNDEITDNSVREIYGWQTGIPEAEVIPGSDDSSLSSLFGVGDDSGAVQEALSSLFNGSTGEAGQEFASMFGLPLEAEAFEILSTSSNLTTTGQQIIICTNTSPITITLNTTPADGEQLHIKMQNTGTVTVSGDIDGETSKDIIFRYDSPHIVFTVDAGEWSII